MSKTLDTITHLSHDDVDAWFKADGRQVFLADVVDAENGDSMSVGFARYAPRAANEWIVTYDEALVVTRGTFSVTSPDGPAATADVGQVIFLRRGTSVVYSAGDDGAEVVYVTYPHWMKAQEASEHAALLGGFQPVESVSMA